MRAVYFLLVNLKPSNAPIHPPLSRISFGSFRHRSHCDGTPPLLRLFPPKKQCATPRALAACCAHNTTKQPNDLPMRDFHAAECRRQPAICRAEPHIPATTPNAMPSAACFVGNTQLDRRRSKQPGAVFSRLPGELIRGLPQWDYPSKITSEQPRNLAARHLARPYVSLRPCWRRTRGAS